MNRAELGGEHHHVADNLTGLAELHLRLDQPDEAFRHAEEALAVDPLVHDRTDHPAIASSRALLERINNRR